jgi:soluble calcium-activated nucleotidase 1
MGAAVSTAASQDVMAAELTKPLDASDVATLDEARKEISRMRGLLVPENGNAHVASLIAESKSAWEALNSFAAPKSATFKVGFIADQDQDSKNADGSFGSAIARGTLTCSDGRYALVLDGEDLVTTMEGDSSDRGAEYSVLENFSGKLVTACDRTGHLDELVPHPDAKQEGMILKPVIDADGKRVILLRGDGKKNKPLKCEWSTQIGGKLLIGSTGKERTDDDGNVVHQGEMWVKVLDENWNVTNIDWVDNYNVLRKAAKCEPGTGYAIHESARWSEIHKKWFFLPRKLSREPYDEVKDEKKCCNLMLAVDPSFAVETVIAQPVLSFLPLRGCSDFFFLPGTNDTHLFITRTEETIEGSVSTYASVIDLAGNVLMEEIQFAKGRKFEGTCIME